MSAEDVNSTPVAETPVAQSQDEKKNQPKKKNNNRRNNKKNKVQMITQRNDHIYIYVHTYRLLSIYYILFYHVIMIIYM